MIFFFGFSVFCVIFYTDNVLNYIFDPCDAFNSKKSSFNFKKEKIIKKLVIDVIRKLHKIFKNDKIIIETIYVD